MQSQTIMAVLIADGGENVPPGVLVTHIENVWFTVVMCKGLLTLFL